MSSKHIGTKNLNLLHPTLALCMHFKLQSRTNKQKTLALTMKVLHLNDKMYTAKLHPCIVAIYYNKYIHLHTYQNTELQFSDQIILFCGVETSVKCFIRAQLDITEEISDNDLPCFIFKVQMNNQKGKIASENQFLGKWLLIHSPSSFFLI